LLAHNGVLFLDELPEFGRHPFDRLRELTESGCIVIAGATRRAACYGPVLYGLL
jgi:magnesium chelatase family protein